MQVTISATSIGGNAGPFAIYQSFDSYVTPVATGVTRSQILAGYGVTVNDATTTVRLISSGTCTNTTNISVIFPSPTPTPSPSAVANIMYWSYSKTTADASMIIYKNYSPVVSTSTNGDSGNFTHTPGDFIQIYSYASIKVFDYTSACISFNGTTVDSENTTDGDSYASITTTAGVYYLSGCQSTNSVACTCLEY